MEKTQFIILECYKPYYTIDKNQYTPSFDEVKEYRFRTKIRLDMIARVDEPETFTATPRSCCLTYCKGEIEETGKEITYQRVVVLCSTSKGINGFQDSLYITERSIKPLEAALRETYGEPIFGVDVD